MNLKIYEGLFMICAVLLRIHVTMHLNRITASCESLYLHGVRIFWNNCVDNIVAMKVKSQRFVSRYNQN